MAISEYNRHRREIEKKVQEIKRLYLSSISQVSQITTGVQLNIKGELYLRSHPELARQIDSIINKLYSDIYAVIIEGSLLEWDGAVDYNNSVARRVFGKDWDLIPTQYKTKYLSNNAAARYAFVKMKKDGLKISDRVWKYMKQFRQEIELALEHGIYNGKGAGYIAQTLQQYLNNPDSLFRRVRDEKGILRLSKAARAFNPGRGVYRSSYKNAVRLARNTINQAYETSNREKRMQQDFVVGVAVRTSPNHSPSDDLGGIQCTILAGDYPKDFDFTEKWHVNCKCYSYPIIKTQEEIKQDVVKILSDQKPNTKSVNEVKEVPKSTIEYVKDNADKWANWKKQPSWITKNKL